MHTAILTSAALVAFAANSVLCRLALGGGLIDPLSFSSIRLASGAAVLWLFARLRSGKGSPPSDFRRPAFFPPSPNLSALALSSYAYLFSFSYLTLSAGTGALILFTSVQLTMIGWSLRHGHHIRQREWIGIAMALGGLVFLVLPGLTAPDPLGAVFMCVAGISWGVYTIRGRSPSDPVTDTTKNFIRSLPLVILATILGGISTILIPSDSLGRIEVLISSSGVATAVLSGAVTSGLGYVVWYAALKGLTNVRAAVIQLSVPLIAALAGIAVLSEPVTARLALSSTLILGGIYLVVLGK